MMMTVHFWRHFEDSKIHFVLSSSVKLTRQPLIRFSVARINTTQFYTCNSIKETILCKDPAHFHLQVPSIESWLYVVLSFRNISRAFWTFLPIRLTEWASKKFILLDLQCLSTPLPIFRTMRQNQAIFLLFKLIHVSNRLTDSGIEVRASASIQEENVPFLFVTRLDLNFWGCCVCSLKWK